MVIEHSLLKGNLRVRASAMAAKRITYDDILSQAAAWAGKNAGNAARFANAVSEGRKAKLETYFQHYKREVPERMREAIEGHEHFDDLSMEECLRC